MWLKGLIEVIVGAAVERLDPIVDCPSGSDDENRKAGPLHAQLPDQLLAVSVRQPEVDQQKIVIDRAQRLDGLRQRTHGVEAPTCVADALREELTQPADCLPPT